MANYDYLTWTQRLSHEGDQSPTFWSSSGVGSPDIKHWLKRSTTVVGNWGTTVGKRACIKWQHEAHTQRCSGGYVVSLMHDTSFSILGHQHSVLHSHGKQHRSTVVSTLCAFWATTTIEHSRTSSSQNICHGAEWSCDARCRRREMQNFNEPKGNTKCIQISENHRKRT